MEGFDGKKMKKKQIIRKIVVIKKILKNLDEDFKKWGNSTKYWYEFD